MASEKKRLTVGQILTIRQMIEGVRAKNIEDAVFFVDFL